MKTKGRIARDGATVRRAQVMLDDETVQLARALGDGNISLGLRRAVKDAVLEKYIIHELRDGASVRKGEAFEGIGRKEIEMMKKSQKLVVLFENIRVETTFAGLDNNLIALAEKLYDETAEWQASGIGAPSSVSGMIGDYCVTILWAGKVPACKPRIKEIMGVETAEFLSKQY